MSAPGATNRRTSRLAHAERSSLADIQRPPGARECVAPVVFREADWQRHLPHACAVCGVCVFSPCPCVCCTDGADVAGVGALGCRTATCCRRHQTAAARVAHGFTLKGLRLMGTASVEVDDVSATVVTVGFRGGRAIKGFAGPLNASRASYQLINGRRERRGAIWGLSRVAGSDRRTVRFRTNEVARFGRGARPPVKTTPGSCLRRPGLGPRERGTRHSQRPQF